MKAELDDSKVEWCKPTFQLDRGLALDQIVERAETQSAGLIVLGVHAESQLGRHVHTSFLPTRYWLKRPARLSREVVRSLAPADKR